MATKSKAAATKDAASDAKPKTTRKPAAKKAAPKTAAKKPAAKKAPAKKTPAKTPVKPAPAAANAAPKASPIKGVTKADASPAPKAAPKTAPVAAGDQNPAEKPADMTKKELIERVVASTGKKPRDVRPVIEATLIELGAAVDRGEVLRLNPFGTMKIQRAKPTPGGRVVVTKIKRKNATETPKDPLAKAAE